MRYKLITSISLCFIFFIGCRPVEKVGPDICPSDDFSLTSDKLEIYVLSSSTSTLEDAGNKLDLDASEGLNIKSDFGEVVDWKITISNSTQSKVFSGKGSSLDVYWYGQPGKFDGEKMNFDPGNVTVELSVVCLEPVSKTFELSGKQNFSSLLALSLILIALARGIGFFVGNYFMSKVGFGIVHDLREELFEKLHELPKSYFDSNQSGQLINRITFTTTQVSGAASNAVKTLDCTD